MRYRSDQSVESSWGGRFALLVFIALWLPAIAVPVFFATVWSHAPLPPAEPVAQIVDDQNRSGWVRHHLLVDDCPCSGRLLTSLTRRGALAEDERMWVISDDGAGPLENRLKETRWPHRVVTPAEARSRFGIQGGPWLVITENGHVRYSGGHGDGVGFSPRPADREIIEACRAGEDVAPRPVLGCATDEALRRRLDPFAWKYQGPP